MAVNGANYFEWTPAAAQIPGDVGNPLFLVTHNEIGAGHGFWTNVASDGSDIRVTLADGTTEQPFHVIFIDTTNEILWLRFRSSITITASAPETYRIYYNSADSEYAVTDPFGRNNVYQDYEAWWGLDQDPTGTAPQIIDYTGNGYDATSNGSPTQSTGKVYNDVSFPDDGSTYLSFSPGISVSGNMSLRGWVQQNQRARGYILGDSGGTSVGFDIFPDDGNTFDRFEVQNGTNVQLSYATVNQDTLYFSTYTRNTSDEWNHYLNDMASSDNPVTAATTITVNALARGNSSGADDLQGILDEVGYANFEYTQDRHTLEYNNENDPGSFATAGSEQTGTTNFDGDVSIGHTLGLSPSASAAVTGGVSNAQTMGMSDQGGATTLASLEQAISLALQTSGAISFEGNITINVSYGQGSSATAQTSAELSGAENVTLFHSYAMSTSAQSSAAGATTIDLSYDQSATGVVGINNFDASVALGDLTYQASITGTAQTVASATQSIQYALDSIAAAAVSSNTSIAYINDISASATVITVDVTLADGRTLTIKMQNRTLSIDSENRTLTIDP